MFSRSDASQCRCLAILGVFRDVSAKLHELDLLERLFSNVLVGVVQGRIDSHVKQTCQV